MALIFWKQLTHTDVESRLVIRTSWLEHFPRISEKDHSIEFTAIDLEGHPWRFCLSTRANGHAKPVLKREGWQAFVKAKRPEMGDAIIFSREANEANGVTFRIETRKLIKTIELMGEITPVFA